MSCDNCKTQINNYDDYLCDNCVECDNCDKMFTIKNYLEHSCQTDFYCAVHECSHPKDFDSSNCIDTSIYCIDCDDYHDEKISCYPACLESLENQEQEIKKILDNINLKKREILAKIKN